MTVGIRVDSGCSGEFSLVFNIDSYSKCAGEVFSVRMNNNAVSSPNEVQVQNCTLLVMSAERERRAKIRSASRHATGIDRACIASGIISLGG